LSEEYKCWECGNTAPVSAMTTDSNGNWVHLYCRKPEASIKEYPIDAGTQKMIDDTFPSPVSIGTRPNQHPHEPPAPFANRNLNAAS
jgi:hypothetical protein